MNALTNIGNAATRSLGAMFPGFFPGVKHDHYRDFGYPDTLSVTVEDMLHHTKAVVRGTTSSLIVADMP